MKDQIIDTLRLVGLTVPIAVTPPACSDTEDPRDNFEMNQSGYDTTECYLQKRTQASLSGGWGFCGAPLPVWLSFVSPGHNKKDEDSSGISDLWQVTRAEFRSS